MQKRDYNIRPIAWRTIKKQVTKAKKGESKTRELTLGDGRENGNENQAYSHRLQLLGPTVQLRRTRL